MMVVDLDYVASPDDIVDLRARLTAVAHTFDRARAAGATVVPSILITPVGLGHVADIERRFADLEIQIARRTDLRAWAALSSALQVTWDDDAGLAKACAFERLWRHLYPADRCACWELGSMADFSRFWIEKLGMRAELGAEIVHVKTPRLEFRAKLHPFHSADPGRLAVESAWLRPIVAT